MQGEALKGHLDMLLLAALAAGPRHGYALIEQLRAQSQEVFDLPEGTVYPALHRLERDGLVSSTWTVQDGRKRRVYAITRRGIRSLEDRKAAWATFAAGVQLVVGGTAWPTTT
jgi:DNA-binding PadR family transcriptional regulator